MTTPLVKQAKRKDINKIKPEFWLIMENQFYLAIDCVKLGRLDGTINCYID